MDPNDKFEPINCLDIGCACGAALLEIKNLYPYAEIYGIELDLTVPALLLTLLQSSKEMQKPWFFLLTYPLTTSF